MSEAPQAPSWREQIRSLDSFGVAGVLAEGSQVYYENLVSTQGVGRVSDLIQAQLRKTVGATEAGLELKLRAALLYCAVEGLSHRDGNSPVLLECGVDSARCAISASFTLKAEIADPAQEWVQLEGESPAPAAFRSLLGYLAEHADRVFLKWHESTRKIELVAVTELASDLGVKAAIEWVALDTVIQEAPSVQKYEALGDLPYQELLQPESASERGASSLASSPTGELIARSRLQGVEGRTKVSGGAGLDPASEGSTLVRGSGSAGEGAAYGRGVTGGSVDSDAESPGSFQDSPQARQYREKINELQARVSALEEERAELHRAVTVEKAKSREALESLEKNKKSKKSEPEAAPAAGLGGFFKKAFSFGKTSEEPPAAEKQDPASVDEESAHANPEQWESLEASEKSAETTPEMVTASTSDPALAPTPTLAAAEAESLVAEIEGGGFADTLQKYQREATEVRRDLKSEKAEKFVDGMMAELLAEKAKLNEMARKASQLMKQKEVEFHQKETQFHNKERELLTEIRNLERNLKQKDTAISRVKDQLAQATIQAERAKMQAQTQAMSSKGKQPSSAEMSALQIKLDRQQRQLEELKRTNQQLSDKVADAQKASAAGGANAGDLKSKLEASTKMLNLTKKQYDQLKVQAEASRKEELRLKGELNRAQSELSILRSNQQKAQAQAALARDQAEAKSREAAAAKAAPSKGPAGPGGKKAA